MQRVRLFIPALLLLLPSSSALARPSLPIDSLDLFIGQMFIAGFRGTSVSESSAVMHLVRDKHLGGVILFDVDVPSKRPERNISSPEQLRTLVATLRAASALPLLVCIDQEGGRVNRLKPQYGFPPSVSAARLGALGNLDSSRVMARRTATTLKQMGITCNFAPVVDLARNPDNPVIARLERSFSSDPIVVRDQAAVVIDAHRSQGILTAIKHFPGHGSSRGDSHAGFTDVTGTWDPIELQPFAELIRRGLCDMVMTAHIFNARLDPRYPATLSRAVITGLLRDSLGFRGVVVSDDMQMKAIADQYGLDSALALGIQAGVDCFIFGNNVAVYDESIIPTAMRAIRALVARGIITRERLRESYLRLRAVKARMGN